MELWPLPKEIEEKIQGQKFAENTIGCSSARVLMSEDMVLKIQPHTASTDQELAVLRWLDGRLPVPKVLAHQVERGISYCLMTRVPGRMACDDSFLDQPALLLERLAEALRMLWALDTTGCPLLRTPEAELAAAREQVERGQVDLKNVEPATFGPGGFRDPEALLAWLESNQPSFEPVFSHGDLCLPNILLTEEGIGGFIDLGAAGVGDRWRDIARCHRSLKHNVDGTYGVIKQGVDPDRLYDALGIRPDPEKLRWYLLLDELF